MQVNIVIPIHTFISECYKRAMYNVFNPLLKNAAANVKTGPSVLNHVFQVTYAFCPSSFLWDICPFRLLHSIISNHESPHSRTPNFCHLSSICRACWVVGAQSQIWGGTMTSMGSWTESKVAYTMVHHTATTLATEGFRMPRAACR